MGIALGAPLGPGQGAASAAVEHIWDTNLEPNMLNGCSVSHPESMSYSCHTVGVFLRARVAGWVSPPERAAERPDLVAKVKLDVNDLEESRGGSIEARLIASWGCYEIFKKSISQDNYDSKALVLSPLTCNL